MDSLLASYASSDDEPEHEKEGQEAAGSLSKPSASISTQLPPLKSKLSLFSSLPPPKTYAPSSSSSLFASLPLPSQSNGSKPIRSQPSSNPNPKRVVQFTLPLNPSLLKPGEFDDDDEEEEEEERKPIKDSSESTSSKALSSMLPAPRNSLCLAPSAASRRSVVDSDVNSSSSNRERFEGKQESSNFEHLGSSNVEESEGGEQERGSFEGYESYPVEQGASGHENYASYDGYENYGIYGNGYGSGSGGGGDYGSYEGNWGDGNATTAVAPPTLIPELGRIGGKRKRNEIPAEIVEVNQAELIKNRPRQDQAKLTGIAFGPAYQPVSTSKGKPSKLHKRKHQIGTLFYDMKQKEMELAERRSKGLLTKAETQAKYGW